MIKNYYMMLSTFKRRIIVLFLFMYTTTLSVIAGQLSSGDELVLDFPGSYDQEMELASSVCTDLGVIHPSICQKKFSEEPGTFGELPPELQIKCQLQEKVTFATTPTTHWQLVVLVGGHNKEIINYSLIEGSAKVAINTIYTGKLNETRTLWTAVLDATGRHSGWRRGPEVEPWEEQKMDYKIKVEFLLNKYVNGSYVEAELYWNTSDDACFLVHNTCNKKTQGNIFEKQIKLDNAPRVLVQALPVDDTCIFSVRGRHGHSEMKYRTPACRQLPGCLPEPERPEKIYVEAAEDGEGRWVVDVSWSGPPHPQDYFNVTLSAEATQSVAVPGNATAVTFEGVSGAGLYEVYVTSVTAGRGASASQLAVFPGRAGGGEVVVGGAWLALLLALVAAAALLYWRTRLRDKAQRHYYEGIQDKVSKLSSCESSDEVSVSDRWEVRPERLLLREVVGEGAFGVVRRALLAPLDKEVAVKMLKDFPSVEEIRSFRAEMELMKSVGAHPHVVSLLACCSGRRPLIVAEYCSRGDLLSYLRSAWDMMVAKRNARYYNNDKQYFDYRSDPVKGKEEKDQPNIVVNRLYELQGVCDSELTMPDLLSFCRQIAMGMEFLASNRVVHRDLAARNILVTADRTLKIADFGLSRDVYQENQYKQKGNGKMPVKWMALESLTHRIYTTQSDVWSFGVVMWEVVTLGGAPYAALSAARLPRLLRAGYRMPRPANCDPHLYELMLRCWHARAHARPTFAQLHARLDALLAARAHPYLPLDLSAPAPPPPPPPAYRYVAMLFRTERLWRRGRSYEWPHGTKHNHYTSRPDHLP